LEDPLLLKWVVVGVVVVLVAAVVVVVERIEMRLPLQHDSCIVPIEIIISKVGMMNNTNRHDTTGYGWGNSVIEKIALIAFTVLEIHV
jgi:hypothetical protein